MALFVTELGMTPAEVVDRATRRPAQTLRLSDSIGHREHEDDLRGDRSRKLYDTAGLERLGAGVLAAPDLKIDDWGRL